VENWHEWRKKGIGSSDAPVIMKVSPWTTPYELWLEKTGLVTREVSNWATQRGNDLEPVARARYELSTGLSYPAKLAVHNSYNFMRASLDGYNEETNTILEIKCPGAADHQTALDGKVPEKYWPQLQHQLMVTGAKCVHYFSYDGKDSEALVIVEPDVVYMTALMGAELVFWEMVVNMVEPPLTDKDVKTVKDKALIEKADRYVAIDEQIKALETEMKAIREEISKAATHARINVGRLKVTRVTRQGTIDYKAIEELKGVDLERYRKGGTSSLTFTISKV